jgi:hypothetical protein
MCLEIGARAAAADDFASDVRVRAEMKVVTVRVVNNAADDLSWSNRLAT